MGCGSAPFTWRVSAFLTPPRQDRRAYAARELTRAARAASTKVNPRARAFRKFRTKSLKRRIIGNISLLLLLSSVESCEYNPVKIICANPSTDATRLGFAGCRLVDRHHHRGGAPGFFSR